MVALATPVVVDAALHAADTVSPAGSRTWSVRGRNAVAAVTDLLAGDEIVENGVPDEYVLLVSDAAGVTVEHSAHPPVVVTEPAVVIVPAGRSVIRAAGPTVVARVFSARAEEQMQRAANRADPPDPRAAPLAGPMATGTDRIRVYPLADIPRDDRRLGRIFRTSSLMVNWFPTRDGPRDTEQLSPHAHADFEQLSVTLVGDHVHHLRVPWTPRMSEWRDDRHVEVGSPSVTLIPPTVVHTTAAVGRGPHTLIDVFAPPRTDFLAEGWVLNADDYEGTVL